MSFDISDTLAPKSDQLDAVDLLGGPRTFTIERVSKGNDEQPVQVHLAEFPRVWRPGKSMRRVLAACWGPLADEWVGRRVTLYCDPKVKFGGDEVGGTRISHLSHIDGVRRIPLLVTKGRSATFTVQPLVEQAPAQQQAPVDPPMTPATRDRFFALFAEVHPTPKSSMQQAQLDYIGEALGKGGPAPSLDVVTESMLQAVVARLESEAAAGVPAAELPIEDA